MLDTEVYLGKLAIFGKILRSRGLEVSPKENADAADILSRIDLSDRNTVKTALRTVYAKSRDEQLKFDRVFDSFFLSEDAIRALDKKHQEQELERNRAMEEAKRRLEEQTPGSDYSEEQVEAFSLLSEDEKDRLQNIRERYEKSNASPKLYNELIHTVFMKSIMEQQLKMDDSGVGVQAIDPEIGILFRSISDFKDNEIPKAVKYINDLAARINGELTKKRRFGGKTDVLDFKRTIRKGLSSGGSFYRLAYKAPKKRRKQLIILCDVSGSMLQFSEFALRLIQSLNEASDNSRIILFSEESVEADSFSLQNMDKFRDYVKQSGLFGRGTNLGAALKKLSEERPSAFSSSTALIILSDVKTVDIDLALDQLDKVRARAGKIYCLNPIPQSQWKFSRTIEAVGEKCTMMSCSTLTDLGNACRRLTAI